MNLFHSATTIEELMGQVIGAGSSCWVGGTGDAVFDTTNALLFMEHARQRVADLILQAGVSGFPDVLPRMDGLPPYRGG